MEMDPELVNPRPYPFPIYICIFTPLILLTENTVYLFVKIILFKDTTFI